jgi:hypothetical protein
MVFGDCPQDGHVQDDDLTPALHDDLIGHPPLRLSMHYGIDQPSCDIP